MTARHFIVPAFFVLCVLLGGASLPQSGGYRSNLLLQLLALPIIVWSLMRDQSGQPVPARTLIWLLAALLALGLLQLVPLPPGIWSSLPGREPIAEGFNMLGQPLPWLPLSLSPTGTIAALLWLLPAVAVLLGIVRLGAYRSSVLTWALIGVVVVSVMVSAMQLTGGRSSPFYFYAVTNFGFGVGFFANSNHQATLLLCTIPFAAALYASRKRSSRSMKSASGLMVVLVGVALILAVGLAINGSLAGAGLGLATAFASFFLLRYSAKPVPVWAPIAGAAALIGTVGLLFVGPLSGGALLREVSTSSSSRQTMVETTAEAAADHLPFGSGIGTFASIYRRYEEPNEIGFTWVNHAHSDVIEIVLETGVLGILLMLAFLFWWGRRAYALWVRDERPDQYARAAVIASAAIIAHSFVDYPLRTAGISSLFAICLALMAQPRPSARARAGSGDDTDAVRHLSA